MQRILIFFLAFGTLSASLSGQTAFSANRPGQVDNPDITPPGNVMVETGFQYARTGGTPYGLLPTASARFGISKNLELSLNTDLILQESSSLSGFSGHNIGSKIAICDEKGILPKISLVTALYLPVLMKEELEPDHAGGLMQIAASHSVGSRATIYTNLGATWSGNVSYPTCNYVLSFYFSPANRFWTFAELYGFIPGEGDGWSATDIGFSWQAARNIQLDLAGGINFNDPGNNFYVQAGAAFQIVHKEK